MMPFNRPHQTYVVHKLHMFSTSCSVCAWAITTGLSISCLHNEWRPLSLDSAL